MPACAIDFGTPRNEPSIGPPRTAIDREPKSLPQRSFKALVGVGLVRTFYEIEVGPRGVVQFAERHDTQNHVVVQVDALKDPLRDAFCWDRVPIS